MLNKFKQQLVVSDDLFRIRFMGDAELSPDGKKIVFTILDSTLDGEDTVSLHIYDLETGETFPLVPGGAVDTTPRWSPDGKTIAFHSTRGGGFPQIYLVPSQGGEPQPLTALMQVIGGGPVWSPDGKSIAFTASPVFTPRDPEEPYRITRKIYRMDGAGYVDGLLQDIYVIPLEGGEPRQLTDDDCNNSSPVWSPDGTHLLFSSFDPDTCKEGSTLKVVDLNGNVNEITSQWGTFSTAVWLPDNQQIVFIGVPDNGISSDLWLTDIKRKEPELRSPGHPGWITGWLQPDGLSWTNKLFEGILEVSDDGRYVYAHSQVGGKTPIIRISVTGPVEIKEILTGDRTCLLLDIKAGKILYGVTTHHDPNEMFIANLDGSNETQLTHINQKLKDSWQLPKVEYVPVKGTCDDAVEAWVMIPPQGEPPYPTILYAHGGYTNAFGNIFSFDFQMLAGAGYAVLFVNPHGSTGYGKAFQNSVKGDWGNLDYQDLMMAVDSVIEKGIADKDRLGVCGLSYGGYMTCWIVGHTNRFKAAVSENPVTNLISEYGTSDVGNAVAMKEFGGQPHEVLEKYIKCSPIFYAHNCITPTLLLQGESDYRDPIGQSEEFYTTLKVNNCVTEMVRFPGVSHTASITGPKKIRKAQNEALLDWMNRYVK